MNKKTEKIMDILYELDGIDTENKDYSLADVLRVIGMKFGTERNLEVSLSGNGFYFREKDKREFVRFEMKEDFNNQSEEVYDLLSNLLL